MHNADLISAAVCQKNHCEFIVKILRLKDSPSSLIQGQSCLVEGKLDFYSQISDLLIKTSPFTPGFYFHIPGKDMVSLSC